MDLTEQRPWWPLGDPEQMGEAMRHWLSLQWDRSITVGTWWERLAVAGLTVPTWQRAHGGLGATTPIQQIIERELAGAGTVAPPVEGVGVRVVGPALRQFATTEQVAALLPPLITGQHAWTVLLQEPDAADPLLSQCQATFAWNGITVAGTKSVTDAVPFPSHALVFARSNEEGGRKGLTCLIVDLAAAGASIEPSTISFEGATLSLNDVLGQRDQGFEVLKVVRPYYERSLAGRIRRGVVHVAPGPGAGNLDRTVEEVIQWAPPTSPAQEERRQR
jgi:alkylation response protein AidB-like acyl-CoA dehydrogenase